jgi:hypothetical protein
MGVASAPPWPWRQQRSPVTQMMCDGTGISLLTTTLA